MGKNNKQVDAYIKKAADFAIPVLTHIRKIVHQACPEVEEKIKWGFPCFEYKGILCHMAAFKQHCVFGFWKAELMKDPVLMNNANSSETAMGHFGKITSLADLPPDKKIAAWVKEAVQLNEEGKKVPKPNSGKAKPRQEPDYFIKAIKQDKKAWQTYQQFSQSNKNEYLEWITEAKTDSTRENRLGQAVEWMAEGKPRNWKYMKKYR